MDYGVWEINAIHSLKIVYNEEQINIILDWFNTISFEGEVQLIGRENVLNLLDIYGYGEFNLYNSLMSRLWIYAPLILENYKE